MKDLLKQKLANELANKLASGGDSERLTVPIPKELHKAYLFLGAEGSKIVRQEAAITMINKIVELTPFEVLNASIYGNGGEHEIQ